MASIPTENAHHMFDCKLVLEMVGPEQHVNLVEVLRPRGPLPEASDAWQDNSKESTFIEENV
jgi:hypothetical protein